MISIVRLRILIEVILFFNYNGPFYIKLFQNHLTFYLRTAVLFHAVDPKTNKVVDKEIVIE